MVNKEMFTLTDLKPVYLIMGTEAFLADKYRNELRDLLNEEEQTMNFASYDMEDISLDVLINDATSLPFFGDHRIIFMERPYFLTGDTGRHKIDQNTDLLAEYLKHPTPTSHLIIFAPYEKLDGRKSVVKLINKTAEKIDVAPLNDRSASQYLTNDLKISGYQIDNVALTAFMERTDGNLTEMMTQVEKLKLFHQADKHIIIDSVLDLIAPSMNQSVFDLVQSVLDRNVEDSVSQYKNLILQREEPIKLNALLESQFRLLLQVKILMQKNYSQGTLATTLKVHPYRVQLAMKQCKKFSMDVLKSAFLGLERLELSMKTSSMDRALAFELFVLQFSQQILPN